MSSFAALTYRDLFLGVETQVPLLNGSLKKYINLDNAASTPAMIAVQQSVNAFLPYYSSVHRGTGFKSQLSTYVFEQVRQLVMDFFGADPRSHTCIFGKNTTEAINKLAHRFPFNKNRNVVLTSSMEHHSNDLPWRGVAQTVHIALTEDGRLDVADFEARLAEYSDRVALVVISGASNVTGYINPIHALAEKAHSVGAQLLADCAQLAPHRSIDMRPQSDPGCLDYVAISAHKMYAPFGTGVLVGRRDTFEQGDPEYRGGGTVEIVTLDDVVWAEPPEREEAGSPNTVGAVALGEAIKQLTAIGMQHVAEHEARLTECALSKLSKIPDVQIYGDKSPLSSMDRLGVIPFTIKGQNHFLVAAILGYEFGVGVRSGCFCAHPYILHLLGLSTDEANQVRQRMLAKDRSEMPGLIRASFGLYNTEDEVDALAEAVEHIAQGKYSGRYVQDRTTGEFYPIGWSPDYSSYFSL